MDRNTYLIFTQSLTDARNYEINKVQLIEVQL